MSIDSLGYYEYYRRLYLDVGVTMTTFNEAYYKQIDRKRGADKIIQASDEYRYNRSKRKIDKITTEWQKCIVDKLEGTTYESGIAGPTGSNDKPAIVNQKPAALCKACGNYGHQRKSSSKCTMNPKNPYYVTPVAGTYSLY